MKTQLLLALIFVFNFASNFSAHAYNHKWVGPSYGTWSNGDNWTNNFPNPTENRAMRLFFPSFFDGKTTYQDVPGLFLDYMEVHSEYKFLGGPGARLGFRNTNDASMIIRVSAGGLATFASDLEIVLTNEIGMLTPTSAADHDAALAWFEGRISGPGSFRLDGGGVEFSGSLANTYSGPTTVMGGTLRLNKSGAFAVPGDLTIGFGLQNGNNFRDKVLFLRNNQIASGAAVTVNGTGWLHLNGHDQTLHDLTLQAGRVSTGTGSIALAGSVISNPGNETALIEGRVSLGFVPHTFTVGGSHSNEGLRVTAQIRGNDSAALIKNGSGTLMLAGTNEYHGGTVVNQGTLLATGPNPLGSTNRGTTVNAGATLHLENTDLGDEPLTISGQGVDDLGALFVFGSTTGAGPVALPDDAGITVWPGHTLTLNGVISGPGGLNLTSGDLNFGGTSANTYTGTTHVRSTTLELRKRILFIGGNSIGLTAVPGPLEIGPGYGTTRLFYDNSIADSSPVTLSGNGLLDLNGNNDIIGSLAGAGTITLGDGELTVGANGSSTTSAAVISGTGGRLRKIGSGTFTLMSAHSFTGGTFIEGGTLVVNGTNGSVTVKTNGTLGGTGLVGPLTVQGGEVSPGMVAGRLNTKSVSFSSSSSIRIELNGGNPGVSHDQLKVVGTVNLGGCSLVLSLGFPGAVGSEFIVLDNDGADAIAGTFAGKPEGSSFSAGGATFQITYRGGDGNDVALTQLTPSTQDFAPVLNIERFGVNQARLLWTTNAAGFHAEWASSLISSNWLTVPGVPSVLVNQFTLTVPVNTNVAFFRLVKP